jgi:hypothetical protein
MYLTSDHLVGGKSICAMPEDLSFIVKYAWESSQHMKEATKIMLTARLDGAEDHPHVRFEGDITDIQKAVRLRLASNPATSEEVLDYLRKTGDRHVCERIATNPRSSDATLTALANHPAPEVRAALSENPYCPITILYRLARDTHPDVRLAMAENSRMPISILEELAADENPFVQARANETRRKLPFEPAVKIKGNLDFLLQYPYARAMLVRAY